MGLWRPVHLILALVVLTSGCRTEAPPRQSLKDSPAPAPTQSEKVHAWCWERYGQHQEGLNPGNAKTQDEKLAHDDMCRPIVCPTCPKA